MSTDRPDGGGTAPAGSTRRIEITSLAGEESRRIDDQVAVEEPLEIRVVAEAQGRRVAERVAVTMRTPGHDFELALGFLHSEGAVRSADDVWRVGYCESEPEHPRNVVEVTLAPGVEFDIERYRRNVYMSSSCGICGRASIERVETVCDRLPRAATIGLAALQRLPEALARDQEVFSRTGGLHAAALFDLEGRILTLREDVGRHNAFDKLVGSLLRGGTLPADDRGVLLSGRASYELLQKAVLAGIGVVAAIGAPSSLAVDLARRFGVTLVGFLREDRCNVYSGDERLTL